MKFPVAELKPGSKVKGTTIAELGNHNRPLDMVVYNKDGKDWILMSNSARGLIKVDLANVDKSEGITEASPTRPAWGTRRSRNTRKSTSSIASTRTMPCCSYAMKAVRWLSRPSSCRNAVAAATLMI